MRAIWAFRKCGQLKMLLLAQMLKLWFVLLIYLSFLVKPAFRQCKPVKRRQPAKPSLLWKPHRPKRPLLPLPRLRLLGRETYCKLRALLMQMLLPLSKPL